MPGPNQSTGFAQMPDMAQEQIKKFELAYFVAKEELPFTLYKDLVTLEKHHGVDIGEVYANCIDCANFVDYHEEHLCHCFKC